MSGFEEGNNYETSCNIKIAKNNSSLKCHILKNKPPNEQPSRKQEPFCVYVYY